MPECLVIKISELAEMLGRSKITLKRWIDKGILPVPATNSPLFQSKGGGTEEIFWFKEDILNWISAVRKTQIRAPQESPQAGYMGYSGGKISFDIDNILQHEIEALPNLNNAEYRDITDRIKKLNNE